MLPAYKCNTLLLSYFFLSCHFLLTIKKVQRHSSELNREKLNCFRAKWAFPLHNYFYNALQHTITIVIKIRLQERKDMTVLLGGCFTMSISSPVRSTQTQLACLIVSVDSCKNEVHIFIRISTTFSTTFCWSFLYQFTIIIWSFLRKLHLV